MKEIINGYTSIADNIEVPFQFENGKLKLFCGIQGIPYTDKLTEIIGKNNEYFMGNDLLFSLSIPLDSFGNIVTTNQKGEKESVPCLMGNQVLDVDYCIEDYYPNTKYTRMIFAFDELNFFLNSSSMCGCDRIKKVVSYRTDPQTIYSFHFMYKGVKVTFSLKIRSSFTIGKIAASETLSEIYLEFKETTDINFITNLYYMIFNLFCFICNRRNISLNEVMVSGKKIYTGYEGEIRKMEEKISSTTQTMTFFNRHKDGEEDQRIISKTANFTLFESNFKQLFMLFARGKISARNLHSSSKAKYFIDIKQSLQLTASFEYYVRKFLPEISSNETNKFYDDMQVLVQNYIDGNTGKLKQKAKSFKKGLKPEIDLKDKIRKVYYGYKGWTPARQILSRWYGKSIDSLAETARKWRNELAHEKNEYTPGIRVVKAVRLVEHLNYCIVLRQAGYTDAQIKKIIEIVLIRQI